MTKLLYSVGDIHGCYNAMIDVLNQIKQDAGDRPYKIVFLGDYVDRGPASYQVVEHLNQLRLNPKDNEYVFLRGNHEDMLIEGIFLGNTISYMDFVSNGGRQTHQSYDDNNALIHDHKDFYDSLEWYHRDGDFVFVHAGLDPDVEDLEQANKAGLIWDRAWNAWEGLFLDDVFVVHGHTPVEDVEILPNQINIDTGCVFGKHYSEYGKLTAIRIDGRGQFAVFQAREFPLVHST